MKGVINTNQREHDIKLGHNDNIDDTINTITKTIGMFLESELDMKEHSLIHGKHSKAGTSYLNIPSFKAAA